MDVITTKRNHNAACQAGIYPRKDSVAAPSLRPYARPIALYERDYDNAGLLNS